jgi:hypothetical protein
VLAGLRQDQTLDAATREAALQVAETVHEDPYELNKAAWQVVMAPGGDRDVYALALRQADAAVQAAPGDGDFLSTLGVAHYRLGLYAKALETLEKSESSPRRTRRQPLVPQTWRFWRWRTSNSGTRSTPGPRSPGCARS